MVWGVHSKPSSFLITLDLYFDTLIMGSFRFAWLWVRLLEKVHFKKCLLVCWGNGVELDWPKGQVNSLATRFVWGTLTGGNFKWNLVTIVILCDLEERRRFWSHIGGTCNKGGNHFYGGVAPTPCKNVMPQTHWTSHYIVITLELLASSQQIQVILQWSKKENYYFFLSFKQGVS